MSRNQFFEQKIPSKDYIVFCIESKKKCYTVLWRNFLLKKLVPAHPLTTKTRRFHHVITMKPTTTKSKNRKRKDKQKTRKEDSIGLFLPTGPPLTPQVSGSKRARHVQFSADVQTGQFFNVPLFRIP
jgi:hypothetical protein